MYLTSDEIELGQEILQMNVFLLAHWSFDAEKCSSQFVLEFDSTSLCVKYFLLLLTINQNRAVSIDKTLVRNFWKIDK